MVTDRLSAEEGQYSFVQSVVRTVAYQTQSKRDRLERHLAAVAYLESLADSDSELNTVISQHLRDAVGLVSADDPQRAELARRLATWLERSAERSLAVGAPGDAVRALAEALEITEKPADQIRLHLAIARAALASSELDKCVEHAMPVISGSLGSDDAQVAQAVAYATNALRLEGRIDEGWPLFEPYLEHGYAGLPATVAGPLVRQLATYESYAGRNDRALQLVDEALQFAEDSGNQREIAHALITFGTIHLFRGRRTLALPFFEHASQVARKHQLLVEHSLVLANIVAFNVNVDPLAGLAAAEKGMALQEQSGNAMQALFTAVNVAIDLANLGRWDELNAVLDRPLLQATPPPFPLHAAIAFQFAQAALARDEPVDLPALAEFAAAYQPGKAESVDDMFYLACAAAHARATGDTERLLAACREVVVTAYRHNTLEDDFPSLWNRAVDWTIEAGDYAGARELLKPVAEAPAPRLNPLLAAQLPRLRGSLEAADPNSAVDAAVIEQDLLDGIAGLDSLSLVPDRARAQAALGRWLAGQGRHAEAEPHLAAARQTFVELRANAWLRDLGGTASLSAVG
jgi:tetratricopeptide (TPR) repeat protein